LTYQALSTFSAEWLLGLKLVHLKVKRKRSRGLVTLLLPALIFVGVIGWLMYTLGNKEKPQVTRKSPRKDNVTLLPIVFEEQEELKYA
jgi:hypothetical protein